eukprot:SAG31_NODE_1467_length_8227_cov_7.040108_5_plen_66_part_00
MAMDIRGGGGGGGDDEDEDEDDDGGEGRRVADFRDRRPDAVRESEHSPAARTGTGRVGRTDHVWH